MATSPHRATPTGIRRASPGTSRPTSIRRRSSSPRAPTTSPRRSRFAAENGLKVAGQGTGHGAAPLPPLDGTILLKTERMRGIAIDTEERTARVEAGVLSLELAEAAGHARAQLAARLLARRRRRSATRSAAGSAGSGGSTASPATASPGSTWSPPTASRRASPPTNEPDLFWALRGGGGGYAIVTALHLALLPIADIYAGIMIFPAELGAGAFRAYRDWAATAPEEVTSIIRLLRPPPIPDVPEPLRGMPLITIDAAFTGGREAGEKLIAPLRAIGEPIMDNFDQIPAAGLCRIHMDPEQPVPGLGRHAPIDDLSDEAIEAFVANGPGPETGSTAAAGRAAPARRRPRPPQRGRRRPRDARLPLRDVGDRRA